MDLPAGVEQANGQLYMTDAKGSLVPISLVKAADKLEDGLVRQLHARAAELAAAIAAFKAWAFSEVDVFSAILAAEHKAKVGGAKGNITLSSFDGLLKVTVQVADLIAFGAQLQTAKALVDECLGEWAADSRPELQAIVANAFRVDKAGQFNRGALFALQRLDIDDPRWKRAMQAITDSIRVIGSSRYVRFHTRKTPQANWEAVTLDVATA
jgi:hypothetical protein